MASKRPLTPPALAPTPPAHAGVAQLVEHQLPKLRVAGSNPVARSMIRNGICRICPAFRQIAGPGAALAALGRIDAMSPLQPAEGTGNMWSVTMGTMMRLYILDLGKMQPGNIPVPGYLIQTPDGLNILVDSGWPRSFVDNPRNPPGLSIEIRPEDIVSARLAEIGLEPHDIDYLVCTHLDDDHSGNHDLFPEAELIVQRQHHELAKGGHPRFAANRAIWDHPALRYRRVEGDGELVPGVMLLETSGHVPGHQSLLVRLPETGPVVLAADAVMHSSMADAATRPLFATDMDDEAGIRASTRKIAETAKREGASLVVYGHDADQWPTLRHAPEFYG